MPRHRWFRISAVSVVRSCAAVGLVALLSANAAAQADLFIRDRPDDTGVEPYPGPGPIYASEDVWIRRDPDSNFAPNPFPTGSPTWTPATHQNPEYRSTLTGRPNYIYVQVHNRGIVPSTGNERLRVYQAKAGTGLAWPAHWVDYVDTACGNLVLHGIEVTKPRRNAKHVTPAERTAYLNALLALQTDPALRYSDGVQFWRKQNAIHAGAGNPQHGNPAFLPWHREMVNRFELHLKAANPLVTLLYWDWTEDPRVGAVNLFTTGFMGASTGTVSTPLVPLRPPTLSRDVASTAFNPDSDATINGSASYSVLADDVENTPNHDSSHGFIGGFFGQISSLSTAVHDPFFFQLHGNVDRQWANWQRNPSQPGRTDPVAAYGIHSGNFNINDTMSPWDGATGLAPWNTISYSKTSKSRSVVNPPIYDTAPLNIPILQPGESVIIEIPWYPPNVADFNCSGNSGHFCLLARIETEVAFPFGMTFPEGTNVSTNTRNNNNIAWKNLTVVDNEADLSGSVMKLSTGALLRNVFERDVEFVVRLRDRTPQRQGLVFKLGRFGLTLPPAIAERVIQRQGAELRGIEVTRDRKTGVPRFMIADNDAELIVPLKPNEKAVVEVRPEFPMDLDRQTRADPFIVDIEQSIRQPRGGFERLNEERLLIGGVRFAIDLSSIKLVEFGSEWLRARDPKLLRARELPRDGALASVDTPLHAPAARDPSRVLLRRFQIGDLPVIKSLRLAVAAEDAVVVFINGEEVFRNNLPKGAITANTAPREALSPLDAHRTWVTKVDPGRLQEGQNVIAAFVVGREGGDVAFDLELTANNVTEGTPPDVLLQVGNGRGVFSPGEPIHISLFSNDQDGDVEEVLLRLDGQMAVRGTPGEMREALRIEEPGVHTIAAIAVDGSGLRTVRQERVFVADAIPPNVAFDTDEVHIMMPADGELELSAIAEPAFERQIAKVALYAKLDDRIDTGLNLVRAPTYPVLDETARAPYRLTFRPDEPGMYMLQLGATDDKGALGVSRHLHVMVH